MLTGQAKKDYQRRYMRGYKRIRRLKAKLLRPFVKTPLDADGQPMPEY